jgi:ElaB/YqjD/DUF883 family membrane-anchored ribosome-binding protein
MNTATNTPNTLPNTAAPSTPTTKVGEHLGEARDHLRQAGRGAIETLSGAADQAREQYRGHRDEIRSEIREAGTSLHAAADEARLAARQQWDHAVDYSKELGDRSTQWVRENPLKALGLAVLGGIVVSRLLSRGR